MSKHTPGPWKVIETHYLPHDGDHVADMSNGLMVVPTICGLGDPLADARLIAAAPDLANVVAWLIQEYESIGGCIPDGLYNAARAAIAKAGG